MISFIYFVILTLCLMYVLERLFDPFQARSFKIIDVNAHVLVAETLAQGIEGRFKVDLTDYITNPVQAISGRYVIKLKGSCLDQQVQFTGHGSRYCTQTKAPAIFQLDDSFDINDQTEITVPLPGVTDDLTSWSCGIDSVHQGFCSIIGFELSSPNLFSVSVYQPDQTVKYDYM